jgi:polyisoprenoid-binding protein YceI
MPAVRNIAVSRYRRSAGGLAKVVLLAVVSARVCSAQTAGRYRIDSQISKIEIHVFRGGLLSGLGDNHVILLNRFSGDAEGPPGGPWAVRVIGESESLAVTDPSESASTRQEIQAAMLGPTQLDATRYPTIEVRSRSLLPGDTNQSLRMLADVTLHGVTRQVEFPIGWSQTGDVLRASGKKNLLLEDFNIRPIRKFLGAIQVRNEFELIYEIALRRAP